MYCMHCGAPNPDKARFCNQCGKPMNSVPATEGSSGNKKTGTKKGNFFLRMLYRAFLVAIVYVIVNGIFSLDFNKQDTVKTEPEVKFEVPLVEIQTPVTEASENNYIANLGGAWEQVKLQDGNFNLNVSALSFSETIYNCKEFTVDMDVTMNAGTNCKDWQVWGRNGGSFVKIGKIYLPDGDGYVSQKLTFPSPVTFDSIAVTPTIVGGYSWSMSLSITDVYTK